MKTITLYINDDVYRDIKNEVFLKRLVQAGYGPGDSLLLKLIEKIEDGQETWEVKYKKQSEENKK
jgi:hypothetical protein